MRTASRSKKVLRVAILASVALALTSTTGGLRALAAERSGVEAPRSVDAPEAPRTVDVPEAPRT
jgi:hypothetical protein